MEDITRIVAIEEIKCLKARYFRYVDLKMWDDVPALFTGDAVIDYPELRPAPYSVAEAVSIMKTVLERCVSVHRGHMPEIGVTGEDEAHAIWAMEDNLFFDDEGAMATGIVSSRGFGHYHETYRREGGTWKIATLKLSRLRLASVAYPKAFS